MTPTAFVSPLPLLPTSKRSVQSPPTTAPNTPTCSLSIRLRNAALACAAIGLTILPSHTAAAAVHVNRAQNAPLLLSKASSDRICSSVAVVGVAKAAIHDYSLSSAPYRASAIRPADAVEDARRELSLATRLITAVMLGAIVGVERSATALNLGVRCVTLISLSSAIVSVMIAGTEMMPAALTAHGYGSLGVVVAAVAAGLGVYGVAKVRRARAYNVRAMSCIVSLCVAMGSACGSGMSLMTVFSCLVAVYVMRRKYTSPLARSSVAVAVRNANAGRITSRGRCVEMSVSCSDTNSTLRHTEGIEG